MTGDPIINFEVVPAFVFFSRIWLSSLCIVQHSTLWRSPHRAIAGLEAAESLHRWFNPTWDLLLDLTAHRQRLQRYQDPDAVPQFTWEQHRTVWLLFQWELIVPDDAAVAAAVRGHLHLYAFPGFEWLTGTPYLEINRCLISRQKVPLAWPRETILVDTSGPGDSVHLISRGPMRSLVDFVRDQEQAAAAAAVEAATTAAAERAALQQRNMEPPQMPVQYLNPAVATAGSETDSTPPTSAHQLWTPPVGQAGARYQYPPPPVAQPTPYAPLPVPLSLRRVAVTGTRLHPGQAGKERHTSIGRCHRHPHSKHNPEITSLHSMRRIILQPLLQTRLTPIPSCGLTIKVNSRPSRASINVWMFGVCGSLTKKTLRG